MGGSFSPLMMACQQGSIKVAKLLLDRRADKFMEDPEDRSITPLTMATKAGCDAIIRMLVAEESSSKGIPGVDVNEGDANGFTALMLAAQSGHVSTVRLLIRLGADPNLAMHDGWTPVMEAAQVCNTCNACNTYNTYNTCNLFDTVSPLPVSTPATPDLAGHACRRSAWCSTSPHPADAFAGGIPPTHPNQRQTRLHAPRFLRRTART